MERGGLWVLKLELILNLHEYDNDWYRQLHFKIIPLRAKQVGEFIEIRHKKISLTRVLSTLGSVTLSLCDSEANKLQILNRHELN